MPDETAEVDEFARRFFRPDANGECLNCDEGLDAHDHEPGCPGGRDGCCGRPCLGDDAEEGEAQL